MTLDLALAFIAYAFVTSITPGPNNTMLLATGMTFGLRNALPHILGVNLGFSLLVLAAGGGAGGLFTAWPFLHVLLQYGGALYMLYLSWKIAGSGPPEMCEGGGKPITFLQAAAFQWVNPKAWIMAIGAIATYMPGSGVLWNLVTITALFAIVNAPCIVAWAAMGAGLRRLLSRPSALRRFNLVMAALLVLSLYPLLANILR